MTLEVLVVEDDPLSLELTRDLLENAGHRVRTAPDGASCRRQLESGARPALILLDILLPDVDGTELLTELRSREDTAAMVIAALTAHALPGDRERYLERGFDAVLTKPIDTRTFVRDIERLVGGRTSGAQDPRRLR